MPHIIVEYAEQVLTEDEVGKILKTIHQAVADSGLFEASHIKTRAYSFKHYSNAGGNEPYLHIQARIKSGRDAENKNRLSNEIINSLAALEIKAAVITVEVIDMDRDSYAKLKP